MKVYIGNKKVDGKWLKGITVYKSDGSVFYFEVGSIKSDGVNKFDNKLDTLLWGLKKVKIAFQNSKLDERESVFIFVDSKVVYSWFVLGEAPDKYESTFSEIVMAMSLIPNEVEIVLCDESKVIYDLTKLVTGGKNSVDGYTKVKDIFNKDVGLKK